MEIRDVFYQNIKREQENKICSFNIDEKNHFEGIKRIASDIEPNFVITDENRQILKNLLLYFSGSKKCPYDLNKGIWISGNVGTGKTLIMDIFKKYTSEVLRFDSETLRSNSFKVLAYPEMIASFQKTGYEQIEEKKIASLFVDDLGVSQVEIKSYGNNINFVILIMEYRYRAFKKGKLTHITTNLYPAKFREIVDVRTTSRMTEMFNVIELKGSDFRRL